MALAYNDVAKRFYEGTSSALSPTGALTTRTQTAKSVEEGSVYLCVGSQDAFPNAGVFDIALSSLGEGVASIIRFEVIAQLSKLTFSLLEDVTYTGGTDGQCFNSNRVWPDPDPLKNTTVVTNPTVSDTGNALFVWNLVGENNGGNVGDFITATYEIPIILNPDKDYILRIENTSGAAGDIEASITYIDR